MIKVNKELAEKGKKILESEFLDYKDLIVFMVKDTPEESFNDMIKDIFLDDYIEEIREYLLYTILKGAL